MFFVGSTGPIITFLLTFILPVFLLTAKQTGKDVFNSTDEHCYSNFEVTSFDSFNLLNKDFNIQKDPFANSLFYDWTDLKINEYYTAYKYPLNNRLINLKDSGNKAPPVICQL